MTEQLKDFRPELREQTHKSLRRIAKARGMHMNALGRQIIEEYVERTIHEAKLILGQDDDYPDEPGSPGVSTEGPGNRRNGGRR